MLYITQTALVLGFQYALVAMALFLSYRILDIADLTTDGAFTLGAAVSVVVCAAGHPILAVPAAMATGFPDRVPAWYTGPQGATCSIRARLPQ